MMKHLLPLTFTLIFTLSVQVNAQNIGISSDARTPDESAGLDIDFNNKGFLIPRISLIGNTDNTTITDPAHSLLVYNTGISWGVSGFYFNAGTDITPKSSIELYF
ncbi:MAG: hypothetical protein M9887_02870 [Chitinophagales bacterium]|nr:hypothetical protein [Chitinophagales bacterium]